MVFNITAVSDFGTLNNTGVSASSNTAVFQAALSASTSGQALALYPGKYDLSALALKEVLWLTNGATNAAGTGQPPLSGITMGMFDKRLLITRDKGSSSTDIAAVQIQRKANYNAGVSGFVNTALLVSTTVSSGVANFEWASLAQVVNNSTAGQNVAGYSQALKNVDGATWAATFEIQDSTTNPTKGSLAFEAGMWANGGDSNGNRIVGDYVIGKLTSAGTIPTIKHFTRATNAFDDSTQGQVQVAHYTKSNILDTVYQSNNTHDLPVSAGNVLTFVNYGQKTGSNTSSFIVDHLRTQNGSNWDTSTLRFYRSVDGTIMGALEFRNLTDLTFNRSIAITMGGTDFFEANFFKNYAHFAQPINMASQSANPANGVPNAYYNALPNAGECSQYVKGGKLVWQYNDAGTIRYLSIPLTGTGTTFTHSTTQP